MRKYLRFFPKFVIPNLRRANTGNKSVLANAITETIR